MGGGSSEEGGDEVGRLTELAGTWRQHAEMLRRYGDERGAAVLEAIAGQLEEALREHETEVLTLPRRRSRADTASDGSGSSWPRVSWRTGARRGAPGSSGGTCPSSRPRTGTGGRTVPHLSAPSGGVGTIPSRMPAPWSAGWPPADSKGVIHGLRGDGAPRLPAAGCGKLRSPLHGQARQILHS